MGAQEAAVNGVANSKLRRLLAHNKSFNSTDIAIGCSVLFYKTANRKSAPRWRGPAKLPDNDETGATVEFPRQTFEAARFWVRRKMEKKNVSEVEWNSAPGSADLWNGSPLEDLV